MLETALIAFSTMVATVGPLESAILFATLTPRMVPRERRIVAAKAILIATVILVFFAVLGEPILRQLGVSLAALKAAGGLILMLIALDMIFARRGGAFSMSFFEAQEANGMQSLSVVPLATPIIAGPGAMGGAIVVSADAHGDPVLLLVIVGVVVATMLLTLALLLVAVQLSNILGATAVKVVTRVFGVILAALATQFAFNGIAESGIFSGLPPA